MTLGNFLIDKIDLYGLPISLRYQKKQNIIQYVDVY